MANQYTSGWTKSEIDFLKKNYGKMFVREIAKKLNRTHRAIRRKAESLNLYSQYSDFKNNNPSQIPEVLEKIRAYQRARWKDKNSVLNSQRYRDKQSKALKEVWTRPNYLKKMKFRDQHNKNKGKIRTQEMKKQYSKIHKKLWKSPDSGYNTLKFREELKKRPKDMLRAIHLKPNNPEKQLIQIIKSNHLPFNYTGNGKVWINGLNPDFISNQSKKIIEMNGEYWHQDENREREKKEIYKSLGYELLVIWQKELENPQKVTEKIIKFHVSF